MAKPKLQFLVDWDQDDSFTGTYDDITADVTDITISHLRDMQTEYMNARVAALILNNNDHKYSPTKQTIGHGLRPGRRAWLRMWYPYDTFTGTADTALPSHALDEDSDWAWVNDANVWELNGSGAARANASGSGDFISTLDFGDSNVTIGGDVGRGTDTSDHVGFALRYVDASNYAYIRINGSNLDLRKVIGGSDSSVATGSHTWAVSTTKFMHVILHGTNVRALVNNVEVLDATLDDAAINAGTKHGLFADGQCDHLIGNFGGYRSLMYGLTGKIRPRPAPGDQYAYMDIFDDFEDFKRAELTTVNGGAAPTTFLAAATLILDSIDFSATFRQIETGQNLVTDGDAEGLKALTSNALTALYALQDDEDGFFYIDGDGYLHGESRTHRDSSPHDTHMTTLLDNYDGTNAAFTNMIWDDGTEGIENHVIVKYSRGTLSSSNAALYKNEQAEDAGIAIPIASNETKNFVIELNNDDYDAATAWTTPAENTDYDGNTSADGTGSDISSEFTVSYRNEGTILGRHHHVRFVAGSTAGYITKFRIRGTGLTYEPETAMEDTNTDSTADYDERRKVISCLFIDTEQAAQDLATNRLGRRKDPRQRIDLTLRMGDKPTAVAMMMRRISDRPEIIFADMNLYGSYFIEGETWSIDAGGTNVSVTWQLRQDMRADYEAVRYEENEYG